MGWAKRRSAAMPLTTCRRSGPTSTRASSTTARTPSSNVFTADSTAIVGDKTGAPICADLQRSGNRFDGKVTWVELQLDVDDHDHYSSRDELFAIAMARQ